MFCNLFSFFVEKKQKKKNYNKKQKVQESLLQNKNIHMVHFSSILCGSMHISRRGTQCSPQLRRRGRRQRRDRMNAKKTKGYTIKTVAVGGGLVFIHSFL